ncbi:hypothetical protein J6P59_03970 [bacterium]|nr:hypothetical protein [bacterium]MBO6041741.1 hypothetical protein [bacterium]MBO6072765.1 hypothetical protein [bacterium]MBO6094952.1 hypothetical protein [bacterium]
MFNSYEIIKTKNNKHNAIINPHQNNFLVFCFASYISFNPNGIDKNLFVIKPKPLKKMYKYVEYCVHNKIIW